MKLTKPIGNTKDLIDLISKSAATISDKRVKEKAEEWVAEYSSDFFEALISYPKAIEVLKYLTKSINNQRLSRKKWLRGLGVIKKSLSDLKLRSGKQPLIFDPNKPFTAYQILKELFSKAKKEILIYDGYVEEGTLEILILVSKSVKIKILTNHTYGKFLKELPKFKKEFPNCEVKKSPIVHDRFFFVGGECFVSGTSLHALGGKKSSYIFRISKDISNILENHFQNTWDQANKIV